MVSEKSPKENKIHKLKDRILNSILNNDIASFLIVFGLFGGIVFILVKLNPGNLINTYPIISFWIFFLLILIGANIYYFITLYKDNKGQLILATKSGPEPVKKMTEVCSFGLRCVDGKCKDMFGNIKDNCYGIVNFMDSQTLEIFLKYINFPLKILLNMIFLFGLVTLALDLLKKYKITVKLLEIGLMIIGIIIFLSILFLILFSDSNLENQKNSFGGFIKEFIFFIPCLLIELLKYFKKQFKITSDLTWILLFLEVIIIIFYFLVPYLFKKISTKGGKKLLKGPIYTNNLKDLGSIDKDNLNYSIALQLWINPEGVNTNPSYSTWTSLFNYGNRPNVLYNGKKGMLKVVSMNGKNNLVTIYQTKDFPFQSWIKIVIIYRGSIIDVFFNNKLVGTLGNVDPYIKTDKITAGKNGGINGGIKDVIYFNRPLDKNQIIWIE